MTIRTNAADGSRRSQTGFHRGTIREFDDDHDIMEAKTADVTHSETHTGVQVHWPTGMTAHPMKQKDDKSQQQQQPQQSMGGSDPDMMSGFNNNQPKGESSIGHVGYYGGSRSNAVMSNVDDPRHRPYQTKPGESLFYAADGHGSALYHRRRQDGKDGVYLIACDGNDEDQQQQSGGSSGGGSGGGSAGVSAQAASSSGGGGGGGGTQRSIRVGHVNKQRQKRKKQQQGQGGGGQSSQSSQSSQGQQEYKHEGDSVNVETRWTNSKIDFYDADKSVGHYDKGKKDWLHHDGQGATHSMRADKQHSHIKHEGNHIWVDQGNCWSSKPIQIKGDDCS